MQRDSRKSRGNRRKGGAEIGRGKAGTVYNNPSEHPDIVKLLPKDFWKDGDVLKIFNRGQNNEAIAEISVGRELKELGLEGVVYAERYVKLGDGRYVTVSKDGGKSIESMINDGDLKTKEDFAKLYAALEVLKGQIEEMGKKGVIHGDIHTGNIVYDGSVARLIDFGDAKVNSDVGSIEQAVEEVKSKEPQFPEGGSKKSRRRAGKARRRTRRHRSSR